MGTQKDNLPDKGANPTVDLIASGYEWICPICDKLNHEIETTEIVTCSNIACSESFKTNPAEHAIG